MKTFFSLVCIVFLLAGSVFSQDFEALSKYEFTNVESYKTERSKVLECANYLFNTPSNTAELNRLTALQYIMKWMEGTPAFTFEIGEEAMKLSKGNTDLLGLYFAGMTKVVLDNEGDTLNAQQIYKRTEALLVDYCANSANKMKPSKTLKKLIKLQKR